MTKDKDWSSEQPEKVPPIKTRPAGIEAVRTVTLYWTGGATIVFFLMIGLMLIIRPGPEGIEAAKTFASLLGPWMTIMSAMVTFYFAKK